MFSGIYSAGRAAGELTGQAWLQAMLDVEAALARAGADAALIPAEAAPAIAAACHAGRFDLQRLSEETGRHATPVVGLVAALAAEVGEPHARHVHAGATSQDVIDTAAMLLARRALEPTLADAGAAAQAAAALAREHARTPMIGRTLLQQALPVSFGLVAAGWAAGIQRAGERLQAMNDSEFVVQLGGPVGAGSARLAEQLADELGLGRPALAWHTIRVLPASLATALGA